MKNHEPNRSRGYVKADYQWCCPEPEVRTITKEKMEQSDNI